jgi:cell division protein ZapA
MSDRKHTVRAKIVGEEYVIRSEASPEQTRKVAEHVDRTIRELLASGAVVETQKAAILAALQITDDYFRARDEAARLDDELRALSEEVRRWLPPAKRGT